MMIKPVHQPFYLDWIALMLIVPLLQNDVFSECKIEIPKPMTKLMSSHLNAEPIEEEGNALRNHIL